MRGFGIGIRNQALHDPDGPDRRSARYLQKWQRTYMAEQATMSGGMVRLRCGEQGFRLCVEHEAQKGKNNQCPSVVAKLTRHARNLTTSRLYSVRARQNDFEQDEDEDGDAGTCKSSSCLAIESFDS